MPHEHSLLDAHYRVVQYYLDYLRWTQKAYLLGNESAAYALAMFDQEREQVKQWQAWVAARARQDERAAALCSDFAGASPHLFKLRLLPQEYLSWLEVAVESAHRLGDRRAEAAHLLGLCVTGQLINSFHPTNDYLRQALSIAQQIDDQSLVAKAFYVHGNVCHNEGKLEDAQAYYEQSLAVYRAIGDQRGMAEVFHDLGVLAIFRRDNATAQSYLEQSLALSQKVGEQEGIVYSLLNLGFLATRLGNFSVARDYQEQVLALCRAVGNTPGVSDALTSLGDIAYYQGNYSQARNYYEQSLALARTVGLQQTEASCLNHLGCVTMAQGELDRARDYFEQSLTVARFMETSVLLPNNLSSLAIVYLQLHEENRAYTTLHEALEVARRFPVRACKLKALIAAARIWILSGKPRQAAIWMGLVENHPDPAIKMTDIKRDLQVAHDECEAALPLELFASAWEEGKNLDLDTVVAELLREL
jgi:tetratricopeptide (TPR) repeat protein